MTGSTIFFMDTGLVALTADFFLRHFFLCDVGAHRIFLWCFIGGLLRGFFGAGGFLSLLLFGLLCLHCAEAGFELSGKGAGCAHHLGGGNLGGGDGFIGWLRSGGFFRLGGLRLGMSGLRLGFVGLGKLFVVVQILAEFFGGKESGFFKGVLMGVGIIVVKKSLSQDWGATVGAK